MEMIHGITWNSLATRTDDAGFDYEVMIRCWCGEFKTEWFPDDESARRDFRRHLNEVVVY